MVKQSNKTHNIYRFDRTDVKTLINITNSYSFDDLIADGENLADSSFSKEQEQEQEQIISFVDNLNRISTKNDDGSNEKSKAPLVNKILSALDKRLSRISYGYDGIKIGITLTRSMYISAHETAADIPMLSDFNKLSKELSIVQRSFVTTGKGLLNEKSKNKLFLRDTILITPAAGSKSLAAIGKLYGEEYHKIDIVTIVMVI